MRKAIEADPQDRRPAGALWARRLMGEALSQAQRLAAERDALTALLVGGVDRPGMDLAAIGRMFTRSRRLTPSAWPLSAWKRRPTFSWSGGGR